MKTQKANRNKRSTDNEKSQDNLGFFVIVFSMSRPAYWSLTLTRTARTMRRNSYLVKSKL